MFALAHIVPLFYAIAPVSSAITVPECLDPFVETSEHGGKYVPPLVWIVPVAGLLAIATTDTGFFESWAILTLRRFKCVVHN